MPITVESIAKNHAKETGYRAGLLKAPLEVIIKKTNALWSPREIAEWMETTVPGTPYTTVSMVERAQRDLGFL